MKLPQERKKPPQLKELPLNTSRVPAASVINSSPPAGRIEADTVKSDTHKILNQNASIDVDELLLDKLRKLRKETAAAESVPAYIVFSDASLRDMCRKKPVSLSQFSGISGVGRIKLEKYGKPFIALIREFINDTQ